MNEKILAALMKAAYKGGGLKVWRLEWHVTDCLMLSSGFWTVLMAMDDMPGKALGLLAEWMRHLPLMNEAYLLQHKQEPEELNVQHEGMRTLLEKEEDGAFCVDVKLTPFWVGEKRAAQRRDEPPDGVLHKRADRAGQRFSTNGRRAAGRRAGPVVPAREGYAGMDCRPPGCGAGTRRRAGEVRLLGSGAHGGTVAGRA